MHIIAEAGTNHGGKLDRAKMLVDVGVQAKADSVKFQIIYPEGLYVSKLWKDGQAVDNEVLEVRRRGMLTDDEYRELFQYGREKGIPISASVFDRRGIDLLVELGASYIKLASCDLNNYPLISQAAETGIPLIISTGFSGLGDIEGAVDAAVKSGAGQLVIMHCVSVYPASLDLMNLNMIDVLRSAFGFPVGLSDHSESSLAAAIAVSKGVSWIEKHYTYDRGAEGFDHAYAMEPEPFAAYIQDIRNCQSALRTPFPGKLAPAEVQVKARARRGLYAARDLAEGEQLSEQDILIVRPEAELVPAQVPQITGKTVTRPISQYQPLSRGMFR